MAGLDLPAIRAREAAATPGPWATGRDLRGQSHLLICDTGWQDDDPEYAHSAPVTAPKPAAGWPANERAVADVDAAFIAHARTDVPALLAEVDRLRALLAEAAR